MKTYRVTYTKIPTNYNDRRVVFVEANDPEHATEVAKDYIERITAIARTEYVFGTPGEYEKPVGGQVIGLL